MGAEGRERQSTKRLAVGMRKGRAAPKQGEWERAGGWGTRREGERHKTQNILVMGCAGGGGGWGVFELRSGGAREGRGKERAGVRRTCMYLCLLVKVQAKY